MADPGTLDEGVRVEADYAEAEQGSRHPRGNTRRIVTTAAIGWALFQLWIASPLPFSFDFLIISQTQARPIHLAFALFLAFMLFPGVVRQSRRLPVFTVFWAIAAVGLLAYGVASIGDGDEWPIFILMAAVAFVIAWMAYRKYPVERMPRVDWLLALLASLSSAYLFIFFDQLAIRPGAPVFADLLVAGVGMVLLLEATRRTLGPALMVIAMAMLFYGFAGRIMPELISHGGLSFNRVMTQQWSNEGVFGIALGVSTSFVFLFVMFGALLERAGAGHYFIQLSFALLGHLRGGPAKAAVVASGTTGLVSGSSIANVVTTGTFTIPLMKRVGYSSVKAGAFEVAASVNGQIMPPIMGAAAFLIAEYVGIPYTEVIVHAFVPAIATYVALFYIVHIEAMKSGIEGLPRRTLRPATTRLIRAGVTISGFVILANVIYWSIGWVKDWLGDGASLSLAVVLVAAYIALLAMRARYPDLPPDDPEADVVLPDAIAVARTGLHYILPIIVLVWCLMVERLSPGLSAFWAILPLAMILTTQDAITAFFRGESEIGRRFVDGFRALGEGLRNGSLNMIGVAVATAAAGIVVATVATTPIGLGMTEIVEAIAGGNLLIILVLTALFCLILGMGLPTTANYIIVATLMAPVIVELAAGAGLAIPLIAAHLFVFYFGLMADVTPPVGLASYAAAAISKASPIATGFQAFRYEMRTALLPFIFVFNTQLLLIEIDNVFHGALTIAAAVLAMLMFVAVTQNWFLIRSRIWETAILLVACFTLLLPGAWMDMIEPSELEIAGSELVSVVETLPGGGRIKIRFEGFDFEGNERSQTALLTLGREGSLSLRFSAAGIGLFESNGTVRVTEVRQGGEAFNYGIEVGFEAAAVFVANPDRLAKELFFIPALGLIAAVYATQRRRRKQSVG
ncbi:MAG: TRAP transporter permease [Alphaproteobacteria bacterium]